MTCYWNSMWITKDCGVTKNVITKNCTIAYQICDDNEYTIIYVCTAVDDNDVNGIDATGIVHCVFGFLEGDGCTMY